LTKPGTKGIKPDSQKRSKKAEIPTENKRKCIVFGDMTSIRNRFIGEVQSIRILLRDFGPND